MNYVVPFKVIENTCLSPPSNGNGLAVESVTASPDGPVTDVIKLLLKSIEVDETWYRTQYADVAEAICDGLFQSAKHHFIESGYFEGRLPGEMAVAEEWYLNTYPDVAEGVKGGLFSSGAEHFQICGYHEGRLPFPM